MPFDHIEELSTWLADAGITLFELSGPTGRLRLSGGADPKSLPPGSCDAVTDRTNNAPCRSPGLMVTAPTVGILLYTHPMHDTPLAPPGSRVSVGQVLALLQIGALLVPVSAPQDGQVAALLSTHGALVGFGTNIIELQASKELD